VADLDRTTYNLPPARRRAPQPHALEGGRTAPVVTKKASKPIVRDDRRTRSALAAPKRRVHALAPEHIGELGSVAALVVAVLGVAVLILGAYVLFSGLTVAGAFAGGTPPPNVGALGRLPIMVGAALLVWAALLVAAPLALLADLARARLATIIVTAVSTLAALGVLALVLQRGTNDPVPVAALGVAIAAFAASTLILARPGR